MKYEVSDDTYTPLVINLKQYFNESIINLHSGRNTIKEINFLKENIVIKSFKIPHIINKVAYTFFRSSKAKKSYINSLKIVNFTPKPIAYIEYKKFGLLHDSYFLCEKFDYDFTIREVLLDKSFPNRDEILKQFANFTYVLHEKGVEHLDYSPGNILIKQDKKEYCFKIVDVNRMIFKTFSIKERLKNFAKLWARDEDLKIIITEYAKLSKIDTQKAIILACKYSQKHKDRKNLKKRLKGLPVVD